MGCCLLFDVGLAAEVDDVEAQQPSFEVHSVSSLDFGQAVQGDIAKVVSSGVVDDPWNASFSIKGTKNKSFFIFLPHSAYLNHESKPGPLGLIRVHQFNSHPSREGVLDSNGHAMVYVGATRDTLSSQQISGRYKGNFLVVFIYQ